MNYERLLVDVKEAHTTRHTPIDNVKHRLSRVGASDRRPSDFASTWFLHHQDITTPTACITDVIIRKASLSVLCSPDASIAALFERAYTGDSHVRCATAHGPRSLHN